MTFRVLIINPMQSPPGVWMGRTNGQRIAGTTSRVVTFKREEAGAFMSKEAAEIEASKFAAEYPQRGTEQLTFLYLASKD